MVSLKAHGPARFVAAGFLGFWLCGWVAGECFALWFLGNGAVSLMSGTPFLSGHSPVQLGPSLAIGGFLLFWLTLWTLGGIAAISEFLRLVAGEDQLLVEGGGLTVIHKRGPFQHQRHFARDALRTMFLTPGGCGLAVETSRGTIELSRLGTLEERDNASKSLRAELGISGAARDEGAALPKGWEEILNPEGERAVIPSMARRRVQARLTTAGALLTGAGAVALAPKCVQIPGVIAAEIQLVLGTIALGSAALWLGRGRMEWIPGSGRVKLRRRFGSKAKDVFEAHGFELTLEVTSKRGDWFALDGVANPTAATGTSSDSTWKSLRNRRRVTAVSKNPSTPRQLGAYLARAGGVSFQDRTTPEARRADLKLIQEKLERSGSLGRFAVRFMVQVQDRTKKQG